MVITERPLTSFTAVMQARAASPSTWTVQAPHSATPQPYFVPMSPSSSRKYQSSGVDGSPSNDCSWPLTRNLTMDVLPVERWHVRYAILSGKDQSVRAFRTAAETVTDPVRTVSPDAWRRQVHGPGRGASFLRSPTVLQD